MTREEAIKILKAGADIIDYPHSYEEFEGALQMAVNALHTQQNPIKLDRSRWGECSDCWIWEGHHRFCSDCGRPLTEAAWVELERRINGGTTD